MSRRGIITIILSAIIVILIVAIVGVVLLGQRLGLSGSSTTPATSTSTNPTYTATGMLHIEGTQLIAAHYKNNPMVMFDVYNEPKYHDWNTWLHGGGTVSGATVVGMQDLVNAIRSVGAKQIIVVEPGSAGKGVQGADAAEEGGWTTIGNNTINDPNIMYSLHVYDKVNLSAQQQDAKWGPVLNHYPLYYGEWAFLPNAQIPAHCRGVSH